MIFFSIIFSLLLEHVTTGVDEVLRDFKEFRLCVLQVYLAKEVSIVNIQ